MRFSLPSHGPFTLFLGVTTLFAVVYSVNNLLTSFLLLVPGAHLVHIPSGFKLLLVLICGWSAALAIGLVSFAASALFFFEGNLSLAVQLALANAAAPLLTRRFFVDHLGLDRNLANLNGYRLMGLGLLYAVLNSSMNQWLIHFHQASPDLIEGLAVMLVGDITGLWIVMVLFRSLARLLAPKLRSY